MPMPGPHRPNCTRALRPRQARVLAQPWACLSCARVAMTRFGALPEDPCRSCGGTAFEKVGA